MNELAYRRRLFELLLDLALVTTSYYLSYWTRYGLDMTSTSMVLFLHSWPIALASAYLLFFFAGVYRLNWRYVGIHDFLRYIAAAVGTVVLSYFLIRLIYLNRGTAWMCLSYLLHSWHLV